MGPKSTPGLRELEQMKEAFELSHVEIADSSSNFYSILSQSALSISLGGSTLVDIAKTRTPALVYPLSHVEIFRELKNLRLKALSSPSHGKICILRS